MTDNIINLTMQMLRLQAEIKEHDMEIANLPAQSVQFKQSNYSTGQMMADIKTIRSAKLKTYKKVCQERFEAEYRYENPKPQAENVIYIMRSALEPKCKIKHLVQSQRA